MSPVARGARAPHPLCGAVETHLRRATHAVPPVHRLVPVASFLHGGLYPSSPWRTGAALESGPVRAAPMAYRRIYTVHIFILSFECLSHGRAIVINRRERVVFPADSNTRSDAHLTGLGTRVWRLRGAARHGSRAGERRSPTPCGLRNTETHSCLTLKERVRCSRASPPAFHVSFTRPFLLYYCICLL